MDTLYNEAAGLLEPGAFYGWSVWLAERFRSVGLDNAATQCLARAGDAHGQVMGMFLDANKRGAYQRVAVGQPLEEAILDSEAADSFASARHAVASLLERAGSLSPGSLLGSPVLNRIRPLQPGAGEVVEGSSAGLAFALAILSRLLQVMADRLGNGFVRDWARVAPNLAVTGRIEKDGAVAPIGPVSVRLKLASLAFATPPFSKRRALIPEADLGPIGPVATGAAEVIGVSTLEEALSLAFPQLPGPNEILPVLAAAMHEELLAAGGDSRVSAAFGSLRSRADLRLGIRYCGDDPAVFFGLACYFAFAVLHHRGQTRALEYWPSASSDRIRLGGSGLGESVNAIAYVSHLVAGARCFGDADSPTRVSISEQVVKAFWQGSPESAAESTAGRQIDVARTRKALLAASGTGDQAYLDEIRQYLGGGLLVTDGVQTRRAMSPYSSFLAILSDVIGDDSAQFREILGRRIVIETKDAWEVGTLAAVGTGEGLACITLGGAWLVPIATPYIRSIEPFRHYLKVFDGTKIGAGTALAKMGKKDLGTDYQAFVDKARRSGGLLILNERVFHPRVLWEVISGTNVRYPAEKVINAAGLPLLAAEHGLPWRHGWTYDLLPIIADTRRDTDLEENAAQLGLRGVVRIGSAFLQDYAAYGRTNASNKWLKVPSFADEQEAAAFPLSAAAMGPALPELGDFYYRPSPGSPAITAVVNARSTAVYLSENLRRQVVLNQLLGHPGRPVDTLTAPALLSLPWFSLPEATWPYPHLWRALSGSEGPLRASPRPESGLGQWLPEFWNPFSWRGVGLASSLAYEAVVAVKLVETLLDIAPEPRPDSAGGGWADEQATGLALSRLLVFAYVEGGYLDELQRMIDVINRVRGTITAGEPENELAAAATVIELATARLRQLCPTSSASG